MPDTPLNPDGIEAAYIAVSDESWLGSTAARSIAQAAVTAYLAVAQPEVNSVEELDALPVGTVVLSTAYVAKQEGHEYPCAFQKLYTGEWHRGGRLSDTHPDYFLPARVLYLPAVES